MPNRSIAAALCVALAGCAAHRPDPAHLSPDHPANPRAAHVAYQPPPNPMTPVSRPMPEPSLDDPSPPAPPPAATPHHPPHHHHSPEQPQGAP